MGGGGGGNNRKVHFLLGGFGGSTFHHRSRKAEFTYLIDTPSHLDAARLGVEAAEARLLLGRNEIDSSRVLSVRRGHGLQKSIKAREGDRLVSEDRHRGPHLPGCSRAHSAHRAYRQSGDGAQGSTSYLGGGSRSLATLDGASRGDGLAGQKMSLSRSSRDEDDHLNAATRLRRLHGSRAVRTTVGGGDNAAWGRARVRRGDLGDTRTLRIFGRKQRRRSEGVTLRNAITGAKGVRDTFGKQRQPGKGGRGQITYMVSPGMVGKNEGKAEFDAIVGWVGKLFNELTEV